MASFDSPLLPSRPSTVCVSARCAYFCLSVLSVLVTALMIALLFDAYDQRYSFTYTTADHFRIRVGSSRYSNTSLATGELIFDLRQGSNANFTLPPAYATVADYHFGLAIAMCVVGFVSFFYTLFCGFGPSTRDLSTEQLHSTKRLGAHSVLWLVQSCVSFPLLVVFIRAYHSVTDTASSSSLESGGREIIAAVAIVLAHTVLAMLVALHLHCRGKHAELELSSVEQGG